MAGGDVGVLGGGDAEIAAWNVYRLVSQIHVCRGRSEPLRYAAADMLQCSAEDLLGEPMHAVLHHSYPDGVPYEARPLPADLR